MTESEWLECRDPRQIMTFLRDKASDRKLRLFFCACCRFATRTLEQPLLRRAVELAERHADGLADDQQLQALSREICPTPYFVGTDFEAAAFGTVAGNSFPFWALDEAANIAYGEAARQVLDQGRTHLPPGTKDGIRHAQALLLRCIVGPLPFRQVSVHNCWRTTSIVALAQSIYDDRDFSLLPLLADTLEEAGCTDPDLLGHLRSPRPHARGCWAVDLILQNS